MATSQIQLAVETLSAAAAVLLDLATIEPPGPIKTFMAAALADTKQALKRTLIALRERADADQLLL